jgi:hypothetical protein
MFRKSQSSQRDAMQPNTTHNPDGHSTTLKAADYEQTLFWLIRMLRKRPPDPTLKDRIRLRLTSEWQDVGKPPTVLSMIVMVGLVGVLLLATVAFSLPNE